MSTGYHIRYLQRQEIDGTKWDRCVDEAAGGLIYGRTFYLDHMALQWDGLVLNDYEAVMPLPWNKKAGFYYLYQPPFTPMLGAFGQNIADLPLETFVQAIPKHFRYWDIDLNEANRFHDRPNLSTSKRLNHFLRLDKPYADIYQQYKRLARRMQKKAGDAGLEIIRDMPPTTIIGHYQQQYADAHRGVDASVYTRLIACMDHAMEEGKVKTYAARFPDGEIGAFYLVLADRRYVYSLIGGSTDSGKEKGAFYLLTDAAIRDHAQSDRIFRFEGSDVPGIAFFDAQFGSLPVGYLHLISNRLPFPANLLKNMQRSYHSLKYSRR